MRRDLSIVYIFKSLHISCESFSKNIAATNPLPSTRLGSEICTFEVNTYKGYKFK